MQEVLNSRPRRPRQSGQQGHQARCKPPASRTPGTPTQGPKKGRALQGQRLPQCFFPHLPRERLGLQPEPPATIRQPRNATSMSTIALYSLTLSRARDRRNQQRWSRRYSASSARSLALSACASDSKRSRHGVSVPVRGAATGSHGAEAHGLVAHERQAVRMVARQIRSAC